MRARLRFVLSPAVWLVDDAFMSLTARPWRTTAMMIGILLGTASATTTLIVAESQQVNVDRLFDLQRSRHVVAIVDSPDHAFFDPDALREVESLEVVGAVGELSIWDDYVPVAVSEYAPPVGGPLLGVSEGGLAAAGVTYRGLPFTDGLADQRLAWLGDELADDLGVATGSHRTVFVDGVPFTVAGVVEAEAGFGYLRKSVLLRRSQAFEFGDPTTVRVLADVRPGSAAAVFNYADLALDPTRRFDLVNATEADGEQLRANVGRDIRRIGIGLSLFAGLMGAVSVANTLMLVVSQRSRELGLRSALGWSQRAIQGMILLEAVLTGVFASTIGTSAGLVVAWVWASHQGWQMVTNPQTLAATILLGTAASMAGGIPHRVGPVECRPWRPCAVKPELRP